MSAQLQALWNGLRLVVIDTETTGLRGDARIVSLALVELIGGKRHRAAAWLVNPGLKRIGASHIHGLTAQDLADAPSFGELADDVTKLLTEVKGTSTILVGHNVMFDVRHLHDEFARIDRSMPPVRILDTARLAAAAKVAVSGQKLAELLAVLGLNNFDPHTADGDATATAAATTELLKRIANTGVTDLDEMTIAFDPTAIPKMVGRRHRMATSGPETALSENHTAAHLVDITDSFRRKESLDVCVAEQCVDLAGRLEDGILDPEDAMEVAAWALQHLCGGSLDRRLTGRLLGGLGRVVRRCENPNFAKDVYMQLLPVLKSFGPCTQDELCGRCLYEVGLCRFLQVRHELVRAYLSDIENGNRHLTLDRAESFMPTAQPSDADNSQATEHFYDRLIEAEEFDAAGYGAAIIAREQRRTGEYERAMHFLVRAWEDGSRNPVLGELYALMLTADGHGPKGGHLEEALAVVDATLAVRGAQKGRIFESLESRKQRLQQRIAAPVRTSAAIRLNVRPIRTSRFRL